VSLFKSTPAFAAIPAAAGVAPVAALTEGAVKTMLPTKFAIASAVLLAVSALGLGQGEKPPPAPAKKEKPSDSLKDQIAKADIIVVGKVSKSGLSAASSFDVSAVDVRTVLKGPAVKTVHIRTPSRGITAPLGKVGTEGVWLLGKEGAYLSARNVVAFRPLGELDKVKEALPKKAASEEKEPGKKP
jgi:hypothetical protein